MNSAHHSFSLVEFYLPYSMLSLSEVNLFTQLSVFLQLNCEFLESRDLAHGSTPKHPKSTKMHSRYRITIYWMDE